MPFSSIEGSSHFLPHHTTRSNQIIPSFSGHETFPFRYTWLKKGIDAVRENPTIFTSDRATTLLGVGKNMVRSIRHWCLTAKLIEEDEIASHNRGRRLRPTQLGNAIFADDGLDPYLEDAATLWLLHWQIATNPGRATTWFWAFSLFHRSEFTKERLQTELLDWSKNAGRQRISENSIKRDVDCFIRTYVPSRLIKTTVMEDTFDCPLVELSLISELSDGKTYRFHRGPKPMLPHLIVAASLSEFWETCVPNNKGALAFSEIAHSPRSPGRVFQLDEGTLVTYLEGLETFTNRALVYDETAGLKQVYRHKKLDSMELFGQYYASSRKALAVPSIDGETDAVFRGVL